MENEAIALKIMHHLRLRICNRAKFLASALGMLETNLTCEIENIGTNGKELFLSSEWLVECFLTEPRLAEAMIVHQLAHCLLLHPFLLSDESDDFTLVSDVAAWDLVEEIYDGNIPISLEQIHIDDHSPWYLPNNFKNRTCGGGQEEAWQNIGKKTGLGGGENHPGTGSGSAIFSYNLSPQRRIDYTEFLKRFASTKEIQNPDYDEFQYSYYTYGLEIYGNLPIIEPLEYREDLRIEELVIVIDTSESCSRKLTQMFLSETRNILLEQNLFFRHFDLRIIQCDNVIQHVDKLSSIEELTGYIENLEVRGGGGTDFRPPFEYIDDLRNKGELSRLKGMLYFTDGYGVYPKTPPSYETALVFIAGFKADIGIPEWTSTLVLDTDN